MGYRWRAICFVERQEARSECGFNTGTGWGALRLWLLKRSIIIGERTREKSKEKIEEKGFNEGHENSAAMGRTMDGEW